jgi:hypothetical protein
VTSAGFLSHTVIEQNRTGDDDEYDENSSDTFDHHEEQNLKIRSLRVLAPRSVRKFLNALGPKMRTGGNKRGFSSKWCVCTLVTLALNFGLTLIPHAC